MKIDKELDMYMSKIEELVDFKLTEIQVEYIRLLLINKHNEIPKERNCGATVITLAFIACYLHYHNTSYNSIVYVIPNLSCVKSTVDMFKKFVCKLGQDKFIKNNYNVLSTDSWEFKVSSNIESFIGQRNNWVIFDETSLIKDFKNLYNVAMATLIGDDDWHILLINTSFILKRYK